MKKYKVLFSVFIIFILGIVYFSIPKDIEFDEEYINSNILMLEDESVEKILMKEEIDKDLIALCTTDNEEFIFLHIILLKTCAQF